MQDITPFQQSIYNTWLRISRTRSKLPYRPRTNWEDVKPEVFVYLTKLSMFFAKHPYIDVECFFAAPYEVYVHDINVTYRLDFYTTHKAISLYTSYLKMLRMLPPDHSLTLLWIKRSFAYIGKFCIKNDMSLVNYGSNTEGRFVAPFLRHVKDGHITIYAMFAFPESVQTIHALEPDIYQLMLGDIDVYQFLREYNGSKSAKRVAEEAYAALDKYFKIRSSTPIKNTVELHK